MAFGYTVYGKMSALGYRGKPLLLVWYLSVRLGTLYHTHMHMALKFLYGEISRSFPGEFLGPKSSHFAHLS
jgi:hypothetical protein